MSGLEIPDRAWRAFAAEPRIGNDLEDAAPIIVAAELRRLVDVFATESRRPMNTRELVTAVLAMLQSRADELDPGGAS